MAILENVSTEEGDILRIKTDIPIVGLIALSQFTDITEGEVLTDYFRKEFRFSLNGGVTFSEWIELTLNNISAVVVSKFDSFVIEYTYTRVGNTPEVNLTFEQILVSGVIEELPYPIYDKMIFNKFFTVNDVSVFGWALNVLEKLYERGLILPEYMERGLNQVNLEDEDFITFWNSITHFFAIIVYFARQFHNFGTNELLLEQFLKSKDLTIPEDKDINEMLYLFGPTPLQPSHTYVDEYIKRGTLAILDQVGNGKEIDGELIRLISHNVYEELIFALFRNYETGWCIGKSSPLWSGTEKIINIIKGYEYSEKVELLSNYPLLSTSFISIVSDKMKIEGVSSGVISGIGGVTHKINIDPSQDYEISFRVSQSIKEDNLVFGCKVFNVAGTELEFKNISTGVGTNYFLYEKGLNITDTEYWVRGVIYNNLIDINDPERSINLITTTGDGTNLRIPETASSIVPIIAVKGTGSANVVNVDNVKIRPLKLNFSRGQLGIHNLIYVMAPNNNTKMTEEQIESFIKENLIPYNSFLKTNWL